MNKLTSVIIPVFNRQDFLEQALDSVFLQTCQDFELLAVDDKSADNSLLILKKYQKKYPKKVKIIINKQNIGQAASINKALKQAKGEYIAILDSDDFWQENFLQETTNILEKKNQIGLVYTNGNIVDKNAKKQYFLFNKRHKETNILGDILLDCYIQTPSSCLARKIVFSLAGGFDEKLRAAQDHKFLIKAKEKCYFYYLDKVLTNYRKHQDSISAKNQIIRWQNGFKILKVIKKNKSYKRSIIFKRYAVLYYHLAVLKKNVFLKIYYYFIAFLFWPTRGIKEFFLK